jgi:hypothetical protein
MGCGLGGLAFAVGVVVGKGDGDAKGVDPIKAEGRSVGVVVSSQEEVVASRQAADPTKAEKV